MNRTAASLFAAVLAAVLLAPFAPEASAARARESASTLPAGTLDTCTWDKPGQNPFMGDVVAAVDRYTDIAPDVRERLRARMVRRDYDDIVTIKRDSIAGKARYDSTIRDMHFGSRQLCRSVSRSGWTAASQERGLVYCDSGQCILVPTICRNVSRIARQDGAAKRADAAADAPLLDAAFGDVPVVTDAPTVTFAKSEGAVLIASEATFAGAAGLPAGGFDGDAESPGGPGWFGGGGGGGGGGGFAVGGGGGGSGGGGGNSHPGDVFTPVTPVPEPETWALMLAGLASCGLIRRRARRASHPG